MIDLTARVHFANILREQIRNLTTANGYELNAKDFIEGFNPVGSQNFPFVCYTIGGAGYEPITDSKTEMFRGELDIFLDYVIKAGEYKQGNLARVGEQALNDFKKFVHGSKSINKDKTLFLAPNLTVNKLNWYVRTDQNTADVIQGSGIATSVIRVTFTENMSANELENLNRDH